MKTKRRLLTFLSVLFALVFGTAVFAACGGNDKNNKETYFNVTVVMDDGTPVPDAVLSFVDTQNGGEAKEFRTGADGIAHADLPRENRDVYHVTVVSGIPEGYQTEEPDGYYTVNTGRNFTIRLVPRTQEETVPYTVTVKAPANSSVNLNNRAILYAESENAAMKTLGFTNDRGVAEVDTPTSGFLFITPPRDYNYNRDYTDKSPYKIEKTGGTMTFELLPETALILENEMSDNDKTSFLQKIDNSSTFRQTAMGKNGRTGYLFSYAIQAHETQFFTFRANVTDNYMMFADRTPDCEIGTLGASYNITNGPTKTLMPESKTMGITLNCVNRQTFTFYIKAGSYPETVSFVILAPEDKNETRIEKEGNFHVTIQETMPALISFRPDKQGKYAVSITTDGNFLMEYIYSRSSTSAIETVLTKRYDLNIHDRTLFNTDSKGNIDYTSKTSAEWLIRISSTDSVRYPLDIVVKIERIGDPDEGKKYNTTYAPEPDGLTLAQTLPGKATAIGIYKTDARVVLGPDNRYHLNASTGPVVYVKLQGTVPPYYPDASFEALDVNGGTTPYRFNVTTAEDMADPTKPYQLRDYSKMLRGYTVSSDEATAYGNYYLKFVNDDGFYPLDDTLKEFLELFAATNSAWLRSFGSYTNESLWLFSAYYYDDGTPLPAPVPTTGAGTQSDPYEVEQGNYSVNFAANTPVYFKYVGSGSVNVTAGNAAVSIDPVHADDVFSITATQAGEQIVALDYVPGTHVSNPIVLADGNELTGITKEGVWYSFTAAENGIYSIRFTSAAVTAYLPDESVADLENRLMKAGTQLVFRLAAEDGTVTVTASVDKSNIVTKTPVNADQANAGSEQTPYEIGELGLYGATLSATDQKIFFTLKAPGLYKIAAEDENVRIRMNGTNYDKNVYVSVTVANDPVTFSVSTLSGADTLYFTVSEKLGYDETHPIAFTMDGNANTYSEQITIEGVYHEQESKVVGDPVFYEFTAPVAGLYIVTFSNLSAMFTVRDANVRYVHDYANNIFRIVLDVGEKVPFSLSVDSTVFPVSFSFTITRMPMPEEGSKDAPKAVTEADKTYSLEMKAGDRYYFVITSLTGYLVGITNTSAYTVYNLGASSFNDDRIAEDFKLKNADEIKCNENVPRMYVMVEANQDCTAEIRFKAN